MRIGGLVLAAVIAMAAAVLFVSETARSNGEQNTTKQRTAAQLREALLRQELALEQAGNGLGRERLLVVADAKKDVQTALRTAAERAADERDDERPLVAAQAEAFSEYSRQVDAQVGRLSAGRRADPEVVAARVELLERFLIANEAYSANLESDRRADARRASLTTVLVIVGLSSLFLFVGGLLIRRERHARLARESDAAAERHAEERFLTSQRLLGEALQVAADQREAHGLVKHHLESAIAGTQVHILNRNNSADRLEPSTPLPEHSPLCEPLVASQPRSCVAVRLSREFERGPGAHEVLACGICGRLEGDSLCRPLLVGGEVIGSVLVESEDPLPRGDRRRIEESVNSAAPVLANLRNLAIAEIRAATDALTGLPNRRAVDDTVKRMVAQASRAVTPLGVLQLDLDHFKDINDRFGHERGDAVLAAFGALLRAQLRASDFAGRSGGEEFLVLLPETDRDGALKLAEKLRHAVSALQVDGVSRPITTSIGLSVFPEDAADELTLLRLADRALYLAKQNGRDRVQTVADAPAPEPA